MDSNLRLFQRTAYANSGDLEMVFAYIHKLERLVGLSPPPERANYLAHLIADSRQKVTDIELCEKIEDAFHTAVQMQMKEAGVYTLLMPIDDSLQDAFQEHSQYSYYKWLMILNTPKSVRIRIHHVTDPSLEMMTFGDYHRRKQYASEGLQVQLPKGFELGSEFTIDEQHRLDGLKLRIALFEHLLNPKPETANAT